MLAFIILAAIALLLAYVWLKHKRLADSLPPGPKPLPVVGNILQFDPNDARTTFTEWYKKYGPMYTVWIGNRPNVIIADHELMQEIFVKRGDEFAERPYSPLLDIFTHGQYGIVNTSGEQWKEQRRFALQTLRNFGFGKKVMEEKVEFEIAKMISEIDRNMVGNSHTNFNLKPIKDICICNIISSLLLGRSYEFDDEVFKKLKLALDRVVDLFRNPFINLYDSCHWLRFIPFYRKLGIDEIFNENEKIINFLTAEVERHKKDVGQNLEPNDFAEAYLIEINRRKESGDMSWFGEWQLIAILYDLWTAAIETTVTTLDWAIILLMHYPEVQNKVQKEIEDVVGFERTPTTNDRSQMPYTNATINEIQRYGNVVISNLSRISNNDVDICGYKIPKGTILIPQVPITHFNDAVYADPKSFNPDRFLEDDKKTLKKSDTTLMPFSLGKRICLGEGLARMQLFLIITTLCQKYSFTFVDGQPKPTLTPEAKGFTARSVRYNVNIKGRL